MLRINKGVLSKECVAKSNTSSCAVLSLNGEEVKRPLGEKTNLRRLSAAKSSHMAFSADVDIFRRTVSASDREPMAAFI